MRRPSGCRRSRTGWPPSSVSSGSTARRWPTSLERRDALRRGTGCAGLVGRAPSPSSSGGSRRRGSGTSTAAAALSSSAPAPRRASSRRRSSGNSASLAMGAPASRCASTTASRQPRTAGRRGASTCAEFFVSPNPGEDVRPLARIASGGELSRVMLALKTLATTDSPGKTLVFDEVDAGIGGRVADVVGQRLQALGRGFQVLCITHLPADRRLRPVPLPRRQGRAGRPDARRPSRRSAGRGPGRRTGPHDGWRGGDRRRSGDARGRCSPRGRAKANQKRKAKAGRAKGERRKRKIDGQAIPDRDVRLPDELPRLRAHGRAARGGRLRAGRRAGRRRRHRPQHLHGPREGRRQGAQPHRRASRRAGAAAASSGDGGGRLPGPAGRRGAVPAVAGSWTWSSARRPSEGSRCWSTRPLRTAVQPDRHQPLRRRVVSAGDGAPGGPGEGLRDHHRGLQRLLRVLRGAVHPRARADAPEGGDSGRGRARRPRAVGPKSSCSGRSSTTTRRPTIRRATSPDLLAAVDGVPGVRRIRFASPHPEARHRRGSSRPLSDLPHVCKHLHLPVQSGSTRVLAAMRRRHTREEYLELVRSREGRGAGHPAVDRYDRRVSRGDRRGLRRHAEPGRGGRVPLDVLVQVPRSGRTPWRRSALPDDVPEDEKTGA